MRPGIIHPIIVYPPFLCDAFLQRIQRITADHAGPVAGMSARHDIIVPENSSFSKYKIYGFSSKLMYNI